jgi:ribosomal protein L11 methylase PrmA
MNISIYIGIALLYFSCTDSFRLQGAGRSIVSSIGSAKLKTSSRRTISSTSSTLFLNTPSSSSSLSPSPSLSLHENEASSKNWRILSSENEIMDQEEGVNPSSSDGHRICLKNIQDGWGDGKHPTTSLCLDFLRDVIKQDDILLDYGTGSGVLSIYGAMLGAKRCLAIEVDDSAIVAAKDNVVLNRLDHIVDVIHTARIYIGNDEIPLSDVTIANILPGPLTRLVGPLCLLTKPGGLLCLSGMRPAQLLDIKR